MKKELIGVDLTVVASRNKELIGLTGKVINETKNTITITTGGKEKILIKATSEFIIRGTRVKGNTITQRPEDRIKK